jgi:hypothetical protein
MVSAPRTAPRGPPLTHARTHALTRGVNFTDLRGKVAVAGADTQGRGVIPRQITRLKPSWSQIELPYSGFIGTLVLVQNQQFVSRGERRGLLWEHDCLGPCGMT